MKVREKRRKKTESISRLVVSGFEHIERGGRGGGEVTYKR